MRWWKTALRELSHQLSFCFFYLFCLSLGLGGFALLETFRVSIEMHIQSQTRTIFGADLSVRSYVDPKEQRLSKMKESLGDLYADSSKKIRLYSMLQSGGKSRLVHVHAIEKNYPMVGSLLLEKFSKPLDLDPVWVDPALMLALDLKAGDTIKLGKSRYYISGKVIHDDTEVFTGLGFAPRVFVPYRSIHKTGLIRTGSRVRYEIQYLLNTKSEEALKKAKQNLSKSLEDYEDPERYRVRSHQDSSSRIVNGLDALSQFLSLVALVALCLAGAGAAYLYRGFMARRVKSQAILMVLGLNRWQAMAMSSFQLVLLGLISSLLVIGMTYLVLPFVHEWLKPLLPQGFTPVFPAQAIFFLVGLGTFGSVIFCLPFLSRLIQLQPAGLFQEANFPVDKSINATVVFAYFLVFLSFFGLCVYKGGGLGKGSLFFAAFLISLGVLAISYELISKLVNRMSNRLPLVGRMAIQEFVRYRLASLTAFLCLGMGSLLICFLPQVEENLLNRMKKPEDLLFPSFFLFDIQPEQVEDIQRIAKERESKIGNLSPMVRARVKKIKGVEIRKYVRSLPKELNRRDFGNMLLRRGANLSFRDDWGASEKVVNGEESFERLADYPGPDQAVKLSLEKKFAKDLNLDLGDKLQFDVQGLPLMGEVANFREVRWNSFHPNFFILVQPGVLDDAPATYLASAFIKGEEQERFTFQEEVLKIAPNVSFVDVRAVVSRLDTVFAQVSFAVYLLSLLSIFAGLVVLFSIVRFEVHQQAWKIQLLKVMGADLNFLRRMISIRFGFLSLCCAAVGSVLSFGFAWMVWSYFFQESFTFAWQKPLMLAISVLVLCVVTARLAAERGLRSKGSLFAS